MATDMGIACDAHAVATAISTFKIEDPSPGPGGADFRPRANPRGDPEPNIQRATLQIVRTQAPSPISRCCRARCLCTSYRHSSRDNAHEKNVIWGRSLRPHYFTVSSTRSGWGAPWSVLEMENWCSGMERKLHLVLGPARPTADKAAEQRA